MSGIEYPDELEDSDDILDDVAESLMLGDELDDIVGDDDHIEPEEF